jgi:hypothetical protein
MTDRDVAGRAAAVAYVEEQWGFVMLQSVWALVAAWGLAALARTP